MTRPTPQRSYPWWVRLAMIGAPSRRMLLFWGGLYVVTAIVSVLIGVLFEDDLAYALGFAGLFLFLGGGHWLAVLWVDRHGSWQP